VVVDLLSRIASAKRSSLFSFFPIIADHDRVNVLAEIGGDEHTVGDFQVVRQKKYALETTSLAVVGGIVEQGDADVESAARRELREELGLVTEKLVPLGRYRTDSNRGAGWVNSFLARNCEPAPPKPPAPKPKQHPQQPEEKKREDEEDEKNGRRRRVLLQGEAPQEGGSRELEQEDNSKESERRGHYHHLQRTASSGDGKKEKGGEGSKGERGGVEQGGGGGEEVYREVGEPDLEYQRPVRLTFKELWGSLARGAFKEVQWSNTVALAALHLLQTDLQSESNLSVLWPLHPPPPPKEPPDMTPKGMQPKGPRRRPPVVA
jgi:8-oxo-dGTP pyrophosphatase MutT (NUDIX family)